MLKEFPAKQQSIGGLEPIKWIDSRASAERKVGSGHLRSLRTAIVEYLTLQQYE